MAAREFDVIIYGATGFTGLRTCQYLARTYPKGVRWAIAGRSTAKLEEVRQKLVAIDPALSTLPIVQADASDMSALEAMTARTKVVLTTVGPFLAHGIPLVEACVKQGTHYIDSTGETPFVNKIIQKYHEEARAKNVVVVPCCGFDSVPSDIGTKLVVDFLKSEYNLNTKSVKMSLRSWRGAASGGTLASACGIMEAREGNMKSMGNQNELVPESAASKVVPAKISMPTIFYDYDFKQWQAYFFMSSTNEKIVKRSHGLGVEADGTGYGQQFSYYETMSCPGLFSATTTTVATILGGIGLGIGPIRRLAQKYILPAPGTGPSDALIAKSHFTIEVIGEAVKPENVSGEESEPIRAIAVVKGGDPGYSETCKYLVESALCLVKNEERVRKENKVTGGVLTPAHAFGQVLIGRLRDQGAILTVSRL
ncbi:hypothetical protein BGZ92_008997 [Podila epicladia]|nr:hypothetical protein BGZ92_008997 [Podila epicladia]